jgi:hypothetical protein
MQLMDQKIRYEIEFPINSSPQLLYQYAFGTFEWFADNVRVASFFTFIWNDSEEKSKVGFKIWRK